MKNKIEDEAVERKYCVYIHTSPNGKKYVGQTCQKPERRWGSNGSCYLQIKNDKYTHPAFANAILKYGWDNFEHEIIEDNLTKDEANDLEKFLIEELNTVNHKYGYNCKEGGGNACLSEETRKKISESHKGEKNHLYGKQLSKEHRKKISDTLKGAYTGADAYNAKKVVQYDLQGSVVRIWDSMIEAERELQIRKGNISKCCRNDVKTVGGYIWRYFEDELTEEHIIWCNNRKGSKRIAQYSPLGELIYVFETMKDAQLKTGITNNNICNCCKGNRKTAGGFIWKYYDDVEESLQSA